ncbi:MAG TPA: phosphoribosylformylglycinamidine synthase, partial [Planctomycetaceae bacterium]|nr:phosphoribosylformylglycinamidine synthase [Planctomycetaceae bacterium]
MLWEVDIHPAEGQPNRLAEEAVAEARDLGFPASLAVDAARGYLVQGNLTREQVLRIAAELLADGVVERTVVAQVGDAVLIEVPGATSGGASGATGVSPVRSGSPALVHVLPKPGVTDPVAESARAAIADFNIRADAVRTFKKYWIAGLDEAQLHLLSAKVLANDAIEQVIVGPLTFEHLEVGSPYRFELVTVPIRELDDDALMKLSLKGQLFLSLAEMRTIQAHFNDLGRDPTDVELETLAQTWSEHCSHKTLAGRIRYRDETGETAYQNMLKETIFAATQHLRHEAGEKDWCVSVFEDNAGVIRFDDRHNVVFKVETHNHPSALEPLRRGEHGRRRRHSRSDGHRHGGQADLQHRRLLL